MLRWDICEVGVTYCVTACLECERVKALLGDAMCASVGDEPYETCQVKSSSGTTSFTLPSHPILCQAVSNKGTIPRLCSNFTAR